MWKCYDHELLLNGKNQIAHKIRIEVWLESWIFLFFLYMLCYAPLFPHTNPIFRCSILMPSTVILFLRHDMMIVAFQYNISSFSFLFSLHVYVLRVAETVMDHHKLGVISPI